MTPFGHIRFAAKSDIGRKRKNNEDAFGVFPSCGVFCVADGMGGGDDGEVASSATVESVRRFCESHPFPLGGSWRLEDWLEGVSSAVSEASSWIYRRARDNGLKDCGSTYVGLCLDPSHPSVAVALHAGDSRLYLLRGRGIKQITKDHSVAEMIGVKSEKEVNPRFRGMILRAVGIQPSIDPERTMFTVKQGDRIVICSDGLSKMLSDRQIAKIARSKASLTDAAEALVAAANDAGGSDNITVVVVEIGTLPEALPAIPIPDVSITSASDEQEPNSDAGSDFDTRETGETMQMASVSDQAVEKIPLENVRRWRLSSARVWMWSGLSVLLIMFCGLLAWLIARRISVVAAADAARQAEMSVAVETVTRQATEKDRRRVEEEKLLRAEDAETARRTREKERSRFQGNVDLPVE